MPHYRKKRGGALKLAGNGLRGAGGRRMRRRTTRGGSFLDILKKIGTFAKKNKLLSRGMSLGTSIVPKKYQGAANFATGLVGQAGYGHRRRRRRR